MQTAKNLSIEPPRSPRIRIRDYAILGRTLDKCRAHLGGTLGEYHYDCPLDNILFGFKKITGEDFKACVKSGASDEEIADWLNRVGSSKTPEEIKTWSAQAEAWTPYDDPEKREWFVGECAPLGLDPKTSTLFDYLEADDLAFSAKAR